MKKILETIVVRVAQQYECSYCQENAHFKMVRIFILSSVYINHNKRENRKNEWHELRINVIDHSFTSDILQKIRIKTP
jgi:hypothetical protein